MKWPKESQDYYHWLLGHAASEHIVCEGGYAAWKMQRRNEWMVDNADELIAVYDGTPGGTDNCVRYAMRKGKVIHIIYPREFAPKPVSYERPGYL